MDFDIPVVIKYIAEPHMHSMPAVTLHPSSTLFDLLDYRYWYIDLIDKYFAAQSLDNQILIYSTDNFRQNRKKRFAGHSVAGYACQVGFRRMGNGSVAATVKGTSFSGIGRQGVSSPAWRPIQRWS